MTEPGSALEACMIQSQGLLQEALDFASPSPAALA